MEVTLKNINEFNYAKNLSIC